MAKAQNPNATATPSSPTPTVESVLAELRMVTTTRLAQIQADAERIKAILANLEAVPGAPPTKRGPGRPRINPPPTPPK